MPLGEVLAILMLAAFFAMVLAGVPVAIGLAVSGFVFGFLGFGDLLFNLLPARIWGVVTNYSLLAIPLFVFMGVMLEKSRLAEDLLDVIGHMAGGVRGGIAVGIILFGVLMGATTGIVGATVVTLGLLTLPTLLRRGYDRPLACGTICASGTLGQIIPPSLVLILLADITQQSVGTLFAAAFIPGLMLAGLYVVFLLGYGLVRGDRVPPIPKEERSALPARDLAVRVVRILVPPFLLVAAVLGSIIGGVAAPTEAASLGALGSVVIAAAMGRLTWSRLRETVETTARITATMFLVLMLAQVFALAFRGLGGERLVEDLFAFLPGGVAADLWFMMAVVFLLGFFLEWIEISYIAVPLFLPVLLSQGVDPVWLCVLVAINLQTSFLTPPFGWSLFYLRQVAPESVRTSEIYRGVIPFIGLQAACLALVYAVPSFATWLPKAIGW